MLGGLISGVIGGTFCFWGSRRGTEPSGRYRDRKFTHFRAGELRDYYGSGGWLMAHLGFMECIKSGGWLSESAFAQWDILAWPAFRFLDGRRGFGRGGKT